VNYNDKAPWPIAADGTGLSLQRFSATGYANDPTNWVAAAPSPGASVSQDSDGDGIPDWWEIANGLDPYDPADAQLDPDGDGLTNLQEYQMSTNPHDAHSGLRFDSVGPAANGTNIVFTFMAISNFVYTIESCPALGSGVWVSLQEIAAAPTNRLVEVAVPRTGPARYFRLRTPSQVVQLLRFNSIQPLAGSQIVLTFNTSANQACTVERAANLSAISWTVVTNFPAAPTNRVVQVVTPSSGPGGFYRLRSP
jgi:hypothetical protein